jgi:heme exporter protein A
MLEANAISCVRGSRNLFRQLSFRVDAGAALRISGPNGAGKTSLLRIVSGLSPAEEGRIAWRGQTPAEYGDDYPKQLVYLGHSNALKGHLSAKENIRLGLAVQGIEVSDDEAGAALDAEGLDAAADMPVQWLSAGQKRRVALTRLSFSAGRELWILDEPFNLLDEAAVERLSARLAQHLGTGGVVVYTTHQDVELDATVHALELE